MAKAKKSFLNDNPALAYISTYQETENIQSTEHTTNTDNTESLYATSKKKELKNRRVNFIMTPSLHHELTILAHMERVSLNELVGRVMGEYATSKREQIEKYLTLVGDE